MKAEYMDKMPAFIAGGNETRNPFRLKLKEFLKTEHKVLKFTLETVDEYRKAYKTLADYRLIRKGKTNEDRIYR